MVLLRGGTTFPQTNATICSVAVSNVRAPRSGSFGSARGRSTWGGAVLLHACGAMPATPTERSARELAEAIRSGRLSAREVVEAHAWRLHRCQPRTNALARDRFADALAEADAADARIAAAGPDDALPPFLGVPCTIKESIAVRGMPHCAGASRSGPRRPRSA